MLILQRTWTYLCHRHAHDDLRLVLMCGDVCSPRPGDQFILAHAVVRGVVLKTQSSVRLMYYSLYPVYFESTLALCSAYTLSVRQHTFDVLQNTVNVFQRTIAVL